MTRAISTEPTADVDGSTIELGVLAHSAQLSVIRAVAATLAAQEDFDIDGIADIRLAIDEACSRLIVRATPGARMVCCFTRTSTDIHVSVTTTTTEGAAIDSRGFGWHVLNALSDSVSTSQSEGASGVITTSIEFSKRKQSSDE